MNDESPLKRAKYQRTFVGGAEDSSPLLECEAWLKARGFSIGRLQGPSPRGVMLGDYDIQKWRNLSAEDRADLHGQVIRLTTLRNSPVVVLIRPDAPAAVIEAFLADDPDKAAQAAVEGVGA
jgi:hypothetical protein